MMMELEAEMIWLIPAAFVLVMAVVLLGIVTACGRNREARRYFLIQWGLLALSFAAFYPPLFTHGPMASEENSLRLGMSGLLWAASMGAMVAGMFHLKGEDDSEI